MSCRILSALATLVLLAGCAGTANQVADNSPYQPEPYVKLTTPEWAKSAAIYQLNTRQFTEQGTFNAAREELPRLQAMGVDIVWLMPIHPIGEENRKGSLGSPYSVKDYYGVNPEFGTLEDLKAFVDKAHSLGMYVILDWVANHTAWDNALRFEHPDWYEKDHDGNFRPTPWWDWSDIIDLDYSHPELREYMTDALAYWVREVGIDGYRCDVAGFVPVDFWDQVRTELDAIKPVFMLAEWEMRDLHANAFDMTYAWSWQEAMHDVVEHEGGMDKLFVYYSWNESAYPKQAYRMTYIDNHDANAWEGGMVERYGDGAEAAMVLAIVGEGMPLVYNGQEAGNDKRLAFFEKDPIQWTPHKNEALYTKLFTLLEENSALWHGEHGATMKRVYNSNPDKIFSFVRQNDKDKVLAMFNFTSQPQQAKFTGTLHPGKYTDYLTGESVDVGPDYDTSLPAWSYRILVRRP
ncbi:alpha-amylase family glycosyl hydrolase [Aestuariibacter salexigens]|uniref:alpha-amylase family glycosyl hydrolase n=1 Tax=Aestuariibacter salexigens TaxID=226010 RepID=UPI0003FE2645|nr:alpha-amylase family glycosyl hydrolase [Aestuariibacter salexigens]